MHLVAFRNEQLAACAEMETSRLRVGWTISLVIFLVSLSLLFASCRAVQSSVDGGRSLHRDSRQIRSSNTTTETPDKVEACKSVEADCNVCQNSCLRDRKMRSIAMRLRETSLQLSALRECSEKLDTARENMPDWCLSDDKEFYTLSAFLSDAHCAEADKIGCIRSWFAQVYREVEQGKLKRGSEEQVLTIKAQEYADLAAQTAAVAKERGLLQNEAKTFAEERKKNMLEQAIHHLDDMNEQITAFSNPVYEGLAGIIEKNRKLDMQLSRNDVFSATIENKFVRRETVKQIPTLLSDIKNLRNRIQSNTATAAIYLEDIKKYSARTAMLQANATNVLYEVTHAMSVDGTISVLDDELLELYKSLQSEREQLQKENLKASLAKLKLVKLMRELVTIITEKQLSVGCKDREQVI